MNSESESGELDREVDASMRMFEKSNVGRSVVIHPTKPSRILVVLDGTQQDVASIDAAKTLRERFNVESVILDARDKDADDTTDLALDAHAELSGGRPTIRPQGESYEAILAAVSTHDVDLVIVPCPFGRSFEKIGADSAGTVIDVLLSKCPKPMLIIRRGDQILAQALLSVRFVISGECDLQQRAAGWAFGLIQPGGEITLNLVAEREQYQNLRSVLGALHPEQDLDEQTFAEALVKTHQSLHGAMAKTASAAGLTYALKPQASLEAPPNPLNQSKQQLLVMPIEVDDRFTQGFVQDRIRRSPHPILIVPGHVQVNS